MRDAVDYRNPAAQGHEDRIGYRIQGDCRRTRPDVDIDGAIGGPVNYCDRATFADEGTITHRSGDIREIDLVGRRIDHYASKRRPAPDRLFDCRLFYRGDAV